MTGRDNIGRSLFTDYLGLQDELTEQELDYLERTRRFVDHEVLPVIGDYWQRAEFPFELIAKMAELGIVGDGIEGYGCPQMSPTASGLINMELSRGDGSLGTFLGVQSGLAMRSIALLGSQEQKQRWLPGMAALEVIGAFALTEPEHGSDSVGLEASLHRDGDAYVLSGRKRWIGNGSIADVVVVWARDTEDGAVKGLLLEKDTPGFQAEVMLGKGSVRAVWQADLTFTDVRVPLDNKLPGANTFKDASVVLASTRNSVAWAALGHAVAAYEVALTYSKERIQFGKPLATKQLVQDKLVRMLAEVTTMQLYCLRLAKLLEAGKLTDTISALAKMNNTRKAREVIAMARDLLGGNGILLENHVIRHMADIEAIYTYEGTADIQTLIVGREITGMSAFT
ncbi:acyl-CoA dehydrogenase family protein [Rhodococcus antarcticus]|jgi:glutaryl-CoA dehydrogenase|uniref:Acyl-CoA dehydrogenase family protein n=1 Tax=Rhodococcus antarcticus TaxID=2987751 RepID=A0ABY6P3F5_9NOCA|nr:acyl-CoA dehydrogenase family protein [Rhodococcus antarcticus]UZJ26029.1 acyl-CoA dehydrogenase family protein [Rhodococcus antarcticus]